MEKLSPAAQTYVRATTVAMTLYVMLLLEWAAGLWLGLTMPSIVILTALVLTSGAIAFHMWTLLRLVQQSDEFMRTVMAKRLLTAAMIVIGGATVWGFFQSAGLLPPFPLALIYIAFFVVHAALIPFINADRP